MNELPPFISTSKYEEHTAFMRNEGSPRGGGFWYWKPLLTNHLLVNIVPDGKWLLYADVDVEMPRSEWLDPLLCKWGTFLRNMELHQYDVLAFQMNHEERVWAKGDAVNAVLKGVNWNWSHPFLCSGQFAANYWFVRNTENVRAMFAEWAALVDNFADLNNNPSSIPNYELFQEHRHDQMFLSLLLKKYCGPLTGCQRCGETVNFEIPNNGPESDDHFRGIRIVHP